MFESESTAAPQSDATGATAPATVYPFRLLADETVLGTFPITKKRRPLGKLASYLFVTDSRVIYAAEAKTFASSSIHIKEYQVPTVKGIEVGRHTGLDALGVAAAIGVILNFLGTLILAIIVGIAGSSASNSYNSFSGVSSNFGALGFLFGFSAVASLVVGAVLVFILRRSSADLSVVGPNSPQQLAKNFDIAKLLITILLFLIFGVFAGFLVLVWAVLRELGVFKATDAQLYADSASVDRIAFEAGALILDVQARGKLAGN